MKRWMLLLVVLLLAMGSVLSAQEDETAVELVPFESAGFGVQGLIPDGWQSAGPGVYARGASAADGTIIAVQSAPVALDQLIAAILPQLGISELPEAEQQIETPAFTWDEYRVEINANGTPIVVSVALTEAEGTSYIVLLQALAEEHASLRESVFLPVVDSIAPFVEEETEPADLPYIAEDVTFQSGDITLAGTLTLPAEDGVFPAVVLVSGSGPQDRNESLLPAAEIEPFRDISDHLTRNGFAVLRYDDRGTAESTGDFASATASDFVQDARAAIDYLLSRPEIDAEKIGVLGHSEGGMLAPEIATLGDVAFIVLMAGPTAPGSDVLLLQNELIFEAEGVSEEQYAPIIESLEVVVNLIVEGDTESEAFRSAVEALLTRQAALLEQQEDLDEADLATVIEDFARPWWASFLAYDSSVYLQELDIPVLAVFGELDVQVDAQQSVSALEALALDNVTVVVIEDANHLFQEAETGALSEYGTLEQNVMPEFLNTVTDWMQETVGME